MEERRQALLSWYVVSGWGGGALCVRSSVSASPMVEMETGGMTAEAWGGEGSPSLLVLVWAWLLDASRLGSQGGEVLGSCGGVSVHSWRINSAAP